MIWNNNRKKSFTLIEILLVIFIIGVLVSLITNNFLHSLRKARDARRKNDLKEIQKALELYYEDKRAYPTTFPGQSIFPFNNRFADPATNKVYMSNVPNDPLEGRNYAYISNPMGTQYAIYACLENDQEKVENSIGQMFINCNNFCKDKNGNTVRCIWFVSSQNHPMP